MVELDAGGQASFFTDPLTDGPHSIDASYGGETLFLPSATAPFAQTVERFPTAVSAVAVPNPVAVGNQFLPTATVANASALAERPTASPARRELRCRAAATDRPARTSTSRCSERSRAPITGSRSSATLGAPGPRNGGRGRFWKSGNELEAEGSRQGLEVPPIGGRDA